MGSDKDYPHGDRVANELSKISNIEPNYDSNKKDRVVYITVAGMSDALSGIYLNISSTLRAPSDVAYGCVLGPKATAG
jgi:hypothetical protein